MKENATETLFMRARKRVAYFAHDLIDGADNAFEKIGFSSYDLGLGWLFTQTRLVVDMVFGFARPLTQQQQDEDFQKGAEYMGVTEPAPTPSQAITRATNAQELLAQNDTQNVKWRMAELSRNKNTFIGR